MPRHETIEANLQDIFSKHKTFFEELRETKTMDAYKNAFLSLKEKGYDIEHFEECFESLRQASQEASLTFLKDQLTPTQVRYQIEEVFIGGETELREELNKRLNPKTVARATLYNYLETLGIRKAIYSEKDVNSVLDHMKSQKKIRPNG